MTSSLPSNDMSIEEAFLLLSVPTTPTVMTRVMYWSYEQISSGRKAARACPMHWRILATSLAGSNIVTLPRQISFMTAFGDAFTTLDLSTRDATPQLRDLHTSLSLLVTRCAPVFHPTVDAFTTLILRVCEHINIVDQAGVASQIIETALGSLRTSLAALPDRKSFEIVSQKLLVPCMTVRLFVTSSTLLVINAFFAVHLFRAANLADLRLLLLHQESVATGDAKRMRTSAPLDFSYTNMLFTLLADHRSLLPALSDILQWYLTASRSAHRAISTAENADPVRCRQADAVRYAAEFAFFARVLSIAQSDMTASFSLTRNHICTSLYRLAHELKLFSPNRDPDQQQRDLLQSQVAIVMEHDSPDAIDAQCDALLHLLLIHEQIIEGHLPRLWAFLAPIDRPSSRQLLVQLVRSYGDIRSIATVIVSFIEFSESAGSPTMSALMSDTVLRPIFQRIPPAQLLTLWTMLLTYIDPTRHCLTVIADLINLILPVIIVTPVNADSLISLYESTIITLNIVVASGIDIAAVLSIYTSARQVRYRAIICTTLPDDVQDWNGAFLSDLSSPATLVTMAMKAKEDPSPALLTAVLHALRIERAFATPANDNAAQTLVSLIVHRLSRPDVELAPAYLALINRDFDLIINFADQGSLSILARHVANITSVLTGTRVLEHHGFRAALAPELAIAIADPTRRPATIDLLSDLPPSYLDCAEFASTASLCVDHVALTHPLWSHVAMLPHWPAMSLPADALLQWLFPDSSTAAGMNIMRSLLPHRLDALFLPFMSLATTTTSSGVAMVGIATGALIAHLLQREGCVNSAAAIGDHTAAQTTFLLRASYCTSVSIAIKYLSSTNVTDPSSAMLILSHILQFQRLAASPAARLAPKARIPALHAFLATSANCFTLARDALSSEDPVAVNAAASLLRAICASIRTAAQLPALADIVPVLCAALTRHTLIITPAINALTESCNAVELETILAIVVNDLRGPDPVVHASALNFLCIAIPALRRHRAIIDRHVASLLTGALVSLPCRSTPCVQQAYLRLLACLLRECNSIALSAQQLTLLLQAALPILDRLPASGLIIQYADLLSLLIRFRTPTACLPLYVHHVMQLVTYAVTVEQFDAIARLLSAIASCKTIDRAWMVPRLVQQQVDRLSQCSDAAVRLVVQQGIISLLAICTREQMQSIHAALPSPTQQELLQRAHQTYLRSHKYYGRA